MERRRAAGSATVSYANRRKNHPFTNSLATEVALP